MDLTISHGFRIANVTGPIAPHVNGVYRKTSEVENDRPVFIKVVGRQQPCDKKPQTIQTRCYYDTDSGAYWKIETFSMFKKRTRRHCTLMERLCLRQPYSADDHPAGEGHVSWSEGTGTEHPELTTEVLFEEDMVR